MGIEASKIARSPTTITKLSKETNAEPVPNFIVNLDLHVVAANGAFLKKFDIRDKTHIVSTSITALLAPHQSNLMESKRFIFEKAEDWVAGDINDPMHFKLLFVNSLGSNIAQLVWSSAIKLKDGNVLVHCILTDAPDEDDAVNEPDAVVEHVRIEVKDLEIKNKQSSSSELPMTGIEAIDKTIARLNGQLSESSSSTATIKSKANKCIEEFLYLVQEAVGEQEELHNMATRIALAEANQQKKSRVLFTQSTQSKLDSLNSLKQKTQDGMSRRKVEKAAIGARKGLISDLVSQGKEIDDSLSKLEDLYLNLQREVNKVG